MKTAKLSAVLCTLVGVGIVDVRAQLAIAQWNFNSVVPDASTATGSVVPSFGTGTATTIGGVVGSFAAGSPRDLAVSDNTAWSLTTWPAAGVGTGTAGAQFLTSTLGFTGSIRVSFDLRQTATASERFQLQATADGTTFSNVSGGSASFGIVGNNTVTSFDGGGLFINTAAASSQAFVQNITYDFASGSVYESNANFGFRIVSVFDGALYDAAGAASTYATTGRVNLDLVAVFAVTAVAVPEVATHAGFIVAGLAMCLGARRLRRPKQAC